MSVATRMKKKHVRLLAAASQRKNKSIFSQFPCRSHNTHSLFSLEAFPLSPRIASKMNWIHFVNVSFQDFFRCESTLGWIGHASACFGQLHICRFFLLLFALCNQIIELLLQCSDFGVLLHHPLCAILLFNLTVTVWKKIYNFSMRTKWREIYEWAQLCHRTTKFPHRIHIRLCNLIMILLIERHRNIICLNVVGLPTSASIYFNSLNTRSGSRVYMFTSIDLNDEMIFSFSILCSLNIRWCRRNSYSMLGLFSPQQPKKCGSMFRAVGKIIIIAHLVIIINFN